MIAPAQKVDSIFTAASELPTAAQRAEYLQRACQGNEALRQRVEDLLTAHFAAGDFLEQPPTEVLPAENDDLSEGPGSVIGPYKLLQQIGEGGMGVVFMAEQTTPIHRTVALKIIKPGMDTRRVIARFEAERQALALMDHPNIAKVLDAGTSATGRPYFVMELVRGVPITEYCDQQRLSVRSRLTLMAAVCHGVQHAHQKGVIHRDLKPTNVLVAEYDGHPVPRIIDFGVAKAIGQRLAEKTLFTQFGQIVGTLEYMSPEQARFNQLDVDTRSDVYSLGVMVYELLVGSTPLDKERLRSVAFDQILHLISEEEPPRPSARLSSSASQASIAAHRSAEPKKLTGVVRGDLDWIVMKALEKERSRRYETASGLALDLERYLADEPVLARSPSAAYRLRKFVRRNKAPFVAAAVLLLTLIAGFGTSTWMYFKERASRERAVLAEAQAIAAADRRTHAVMLLSNMLAGAAPAAGGEDDMLLDEALDMIGANHEASVLLNTFGETLRQRGKFRQSERLLQRALEIDHSIPGEGDFNMAATMNNLSLSIISQGRVDEGKRMVLQSLAIIQQAKGSDDWNCAMPLNNLGFLLRWQGQYDESEKTLKKAFEISNPSLGESHPTTLLIRINQVELARDRGALDEASRQALELLEFLRTHPGTDERLLADTLTSLADINLAKKDFVAAETYARDALTACQRVQPDGWAQFTIMSTLGASLDGQQRHTDAEPQLLNAYDGLKPRLNQVPVCYLNTFEDLLQHLQKHYEATGNADETSRWQQELSSFGHPSLATSQRSAN